MTLANLMYMLSFKSLFLFFWVLGSLSSVHALSCRQVLDTRLSDGQNLSLPREVRLSRENISSVLDSPDAPYLIHMGSLFSKLEDPVLMTSLRYTFRGFTPNPDPFKRRLLRRSENAEEFRQRLAEVTGQDVTDTDHLVAIWNLEKALTEDLAGDLLDPPDLTLLAYVLSFSYSQIDFASGQEKGRIDLARSSEEEPRQRMFEEIFISPRLKRDMQVVFQDPLFIENLRPLLEAQIDLSFIENAATLKNLNPRKAQKLSHNKSSQALVDLALHMITNPQKIFNEADAHSFYKNLLILGRDRALERLESHLFRLISQARLVEKVLNHVDHFYTGTPLPLGSHQLESLLGVGANKALMSIKARASEAKAQRTEEARTQARLSALQQIEAGDFRTYTPPPSYDSENAPNPNKRKNQNREQRDQTDTTRPNQDTSPQTFADDLVPEADQIYHFSFLRSPDLESQSVVFSEEIVSEFETQSKLRWTPFLKALNYGFTSRSGQNGIKKMGVNIGLQNIYEIQPGVSSFRILLRREGNHWVALAVLHKDKIDAYLQALQ